MNSLRTGLAVATASLAFAGGQSAAANEAGKCAPVYDETTHHINPELTAAIGDLAQKGVEAHVIVLDKPRHHPLETQDDVYFYVSDLDVDCDRVEDVHGLNVAVDLNSDNTFVGEYWGEGTEDTGTEIFTEQEARTFYQAVKSNKQPVQQTAAEFLAAVNDGGYPPTEAERKASAKTGYKAVATGGLVGIAIMSVVLAGASASEARAKRLRETTEAPTVSGAPPQPDPIALPNGDKRDQVIQIPGSPYTSKGAVKSKR